MRKEVHAAYGRSTAKHKRKALSAKAPGALRPAVRVGALVCILGTAAYLLFTWNNAEPQPVQARQNTKASALAIPQTELHPGQAMPENTTSKVTEPIPSQPNPATPLEWLAGLSGALSQATPAQKLTAEKLLTFANSGRMSEVREVSRDDVLSLAELLTTELGSQAVADALEARLGMPASSFLAHPHPAQALADLYEAVTKETQAADPRPLLFSDGVEPDGTITGQVHVIPAGTRRVYASFENQGALQNLDRVLAVWRNPADDKMVFTEFEPVRPGATYNYVWLELKEGWPAGFYKLDLFHPQRSTELLASRSFNVR